MFVYGTLKKGFGNNHLLSGDTFVGEATTLPNFTMFSMGGFPGVSKEGETQIRGEIYEVSPSTLERLDRLEGHPNWYIREEVPTSLGRAWIYLQPANSRGGKNIPSGIWEGVKW